jgi:hypothetical protein
MPAALIPADDRPAYEYARSVRCGQTESGSIHRQFIARLHKKEVARERRKNNGEKRGSTPSEEQAQASGHGEQDKWGKRQRQIDERYGYSRETGDSESNDVSRNGWTSAGRRLTQIAATVATSVR